MTDASAIMEDPLQYWNMMIYTEVRKDETPVQLLMNLLIQTTAFGVIL